MGCEQDQSGHRTGHLIIISRMQKDNFSKKKIKWKKDSVYIILNYDQNTNLNNGFISFLIEKTSWKKRMSNQDYIKFLNLLDY